MNEKRMNEMKKIVLTLCKVFPATSMYAGEPTGFEEKLKSGKKIHTIRANRKGIWDRLHRDIVSGKKFLCVREWTGRPYNSEQREYARYDEIGLQHVEMFRSTPMVCKVDGRDVPVEELAANDGLTYDQFMDMIFGNEDYFSGVIIHFTDFRY